MPALIPINVLVAENRDGSGGRRRPPSKTNETPSVKTVGEEHPGIAARTCELVPKPALDGPVNIREGTRPSGGSRCSDPASARSVRRSSAEELDMEDGQARFARSFQVASSPTVPSKHAANGHPAVKTGAWQGSTATGGQSSTINE